MISHPTQNVRLAIEKGFTLLEVLVAVAIIGILLALLVPSGITLVEKGNRAKCVNQLRQIGTGYRSYAAENNNRYPPALFANNWPFGDLRGEAGPFSLVSGGHISDIGVFYCPSSKRFSKLDWKPANSENTYVGYSFFVQPWRGESDNFAADAFSRMRSILAMDVCARDSGEDSSWSHSAGRPEGGNLLFNDGSVEWRKYSDMSERFSLAGQRFFW